MKRTLLCFDILDDLSDELSIRDYPHFLGINGLTIELQYKVIKRIEYYYSLAKYTVERVAELACEYNDLDALIWFDNNGVHSDLPEDQHPFYTGFGPYMVTIACRKGYLDIVKWLIINRSINIGTSHAMREACRYGHLDVIKWLHKDAKLSYRTVEMVNLAISKGHLDIVEWFYDEHYDFECSSESIENACKNGHLEVVKWLYDKKPRGFEPPTEFIERISEDPSFRVARWIWDNHLSDHPGDDE